MCHSPIPTPRNKRAKSGPKGVQRRIDRHEGRPNRRALGAQEDGRAAADPVVLVS